MVRLLAEGGAKIDITLHGESFLHVALDGPLEMLKVLVQFCMALDVNARGNGQCTALYIASRLG